MKTANELNRYTSIRGFKPLPKTSVVEWADTYRILSNGETSGAEGNLVESFVVEKWYLEDAGREVEIVGFYLVDEKTNAVTDEETTSW